MLVMTLLGALYWALHWFISNKAMVDWASHPVPTALSGLGILAAITCLGALIRQARRAVADCDNRWQRLSAAVVLIIGIPGGILISCQGDPATMIATVPLAVLIIAGSTALGALLGLTVSQGEPTTPTRLFDQDTLNQLHDMAGMPPAAIVTPPPTKQAEVSPAPTADPEPTPEAASNEPAPEPPEDDLSALGAEVLNQQVWTDDEKRKIFGA